MLALSCLCGGVRLRAERPAFVHECNCALCSKSGARWGYYHPDQVQVEGATHGYVRADKGEPAADLRFCATCGSTTHFVLTAQAAAKYGNTMMGMNTRLAPDADLAGVEVRYPDGANWNGAGDFAYLREPQIIGAV